MTLAGFQMTVKQALIIIGMKMEIITLEEMKKKISN